MSVNDYGLGRRVSVDARDARYPVRRLLEETPPALPVVKHWRTDLGPSSAEFGIIAMANEMCPALLIQSGRGQPVEEADVESLPREALHACTYCGRAFPRTPEYFGKHKRKPDGLRSECRECTRAINRASQERLQGETPNGEPCTCRKCGGIFPRTSEYFIRHSQTRDGLRSLCHECKRTMDRQYGNTHKEAIAAYNKERYHAAIPLERARYQKYYANPAARAAARQRAREWRKNNPERRSLQTHERRARMRGLMAQRVPASFAAQHKDDPCHYCGGEANSWDHVIPLSRGGAHALENLVRACLSCNMRKKHRTPEEFAAYLRKDQP